MPALTASDKQIKINKSMKTKNPLKAIKHQMIKLLKKRKSSSVDNKDIKSKSKRKRDLLVQIPSLSLTKNNSYTPSEPMALCNQLSESQSYPSDDHYARSSSDYMEAIENTQFHSPSPSPSPSYSRSYKLLSTKAMSTKQFPKLPEFTDSEYEILNEGWRILTNVDINILSSEFKDILLNMDMENGILYKEHFVNSDIDIDINESIFDLFFGILNKMVVDNEYRVIGDKHNNDNDMLMATSIVLRMIGIRYAIKYKIIPTDYNVFKTCFDKLFIKFSSSNNTKFHTLLNKCWNHIITSITIAFDTDSY